MLYILVQNGIYYDFFRKDLKITTSLWIHLSSSHCALFTCVPCQLVQAAFGGPTQRQPSWTWSKQVRINPINFPWNCTFPRQGNAKLYTTSTTSTQMNFVLLLLLANWAIKVVLKFLQLRIILLRMFFSKF